MILTKGLPLPPLSSSMILTKGLPMWLFGLVKMGARRLAIGWSFLFCVSDSPVVLCTNAASFSSISSEPNSRSHGGLNDIINHVLDREFFLSAEAYEYSILFSLSDISPRSLGFQVLSKKKFAATKTCIVNMKPKAQNAQAPLRGSGPASDSFPDLSLYKAPSGRLMSSLPISLVPYAELMRLHKFMGYYAFYVPHLVGTLYASALMDPIPSPLQLLRANVFLSVGSLLLRGAACTWNDILDAPFDRLVARCRYRPIARGAVSPFAAKIFTIIQSAFAATILYQLPPTCLPPATALVVTQGLYPFAKRLTNYPQVLLGISLAMGQFVGAAGMGMDLLQLTRREDIAAMGCLYASNIVNAMIYDAVYAHQDLKDDLKAGVKSVAVAWQDHTKPVLCLLSTAEVILLGAAGHLIQLGPIYFASAVFGTAAILCTMIWKVNLEIPNSCWLWFKWTICLTGAAISCGLLAEYLVLL